MTFVSIETVRGSNASLKYPGPSFVAVFVGGTSSIGVSTLKAFVSSTTSPRIYIVDRNQKAADRIIKEYNELSGGQANVQFVKADLTELANVDRVCQEIKAKEERVNLLVLSPGYLALRGRTGNRFLPLRCDCHQGTAAHDLLNFQKVSTEN